MLKSLFVLAIAALSLVSGCVKYVPLGQALAPELAQETAALVRVDDDGDVSPFCSGVWISKSEILTAYHCIEDETDIKIVTRNNAPQMFEQPGAMEVAYVSKTDPDHDLAVLVTDGLSIHGIATLAPTVPPIGARLFVVGQPMGMYWTQISGTVGQLYNTMKVVDLKGPFLQVIAPVTYGNSGGGVFDENGGLIGIVSFMPRRAPGIAFAIRLESIRGFISPTVR